MKTLLPQYDPRKYHANVQANQMNNYLRLARITHVDSSKGVCDIEWLDHPGTRSNVVLSLAGQGLYDIPTPGTVVLVAFDKGYNALIVRTLSQNFPALNGTADQSVAQMRKLTPGDKLFVSFRNTDDATQLTPVTSGAELLLTNTGDIVINDINGQFWHVDSQNLLIEQSSINHRISTEAGVIDFGLIKRDFPAFTQSGQTESRILNTSGLPISPGEKALTEFRVRITETSDTDLTTPPEIDNPLVELTLGTKIKETNVGDITTYELDRTDSSHAVAGQEIVVQLKTRANQGFELTVDKQGNVTFKVNGNIKFNVVGGDISLDVTSGNQVNVGGENGEKLLQGESFQKKFNALVDYVNKLSFVNTAGVVTPCIQSTPAGTAQKSTNTDLSKKVKAE